MRKLIKYPKIEQFRQVVRGVINKATFKGLYESGEPIFDSSAELPTLKFKGTVKLHGTNTSIGFDGNEEIWVQSRNNILGEGRDNAGFKEYVFEYEDYWRETLNELYNMHAKPGDLITLYGEWAGKNIQKGVGISAIPKSFFIFGLKITPSDEERDGFWVDISDYNFIYGYRAYNINDFRTYELDIDFNNPKLIQNELIRITEEVEKNCPVARVLGESGTGEGVVWSCEYKGKVFRFKVKGEKHSVSKVKKLAEVDVEEIKAIQDFVNYAVTENRVDQAIDEVFTKQGIDPSRKGTGDFLRWMANDIMTEEEDTLFKNNLTWREVAKEAQTRARQIFFNKIDMI